MFAFTQGRGKPRNGGAFVMAKSLKPLMHSFCSRVGVAGTGWAARREFRRAKIKPGNGSNTAVRKHFLLPFILSPRKEMLWSNKYFALLVTAGNRSFTLQGNPITVIPSFRSQATLSPPTFLSTFLPHAATALCTSHSGQICQAEDAQIISSSALRDSRGMKVLAANPE